MKIAVVTPVYPPRVGGIGNAARCFAEGVAAVGHAVTVFTPDYGERRLPPTPSVRVQYLRPVMRWGNAAWVPQLYPVLRSFRIVHLHYPFFGGAEAVLARRWRGGRLVLHYQMDTVGQGLRRAVFRTYRQLVLPQLLRAADRILVSSLDYAEHSQLTPWLPSVRDKLEVLPNGVDTARFSPGEEPVLAERYQLAGKRVVLFVGGLDAAHYFKGLEYLIQAVAMLPTDVALLVVGRGDRLTYFRSLAQHSGAAGRILFTSAVTDVALPSHYRVADVVVLPSVDRSEAFGIVLVEAMACAKPVIASDLPGVRTVVRSGVNGQLVPPRDSNALMLAIGHLLDYPQEARRMGAAGRTLAQAHYDWAVGCRQLTSLYAKL